MSASVTTGTSLVGLLGETRAALVEFLHRTGPQPVSELAAHLGISEVATRRHLGVLLDDGLVEQRDARASGGRPATCFALSARAERLFPQSYDRLANELLDFLTAEHGRDGLLAFMRWRVDREVGTLAAAVGPGPLDQRVRQLADALSEAGFLADVVQDEDEGEDGVERGRGLPTLRLVQHHCVIEGGAREHPEICAYEAAAFSRALGTDVTVSRDETIAGGASACVCTVRPSTA